MLAVACVPVCFARGLAVSAHQWETAAREVDGPARGIA
jgi:hypothetical protein